MENVDGVQILIASPGTTSGHQITFKWSPAVGFTGGTATTIPAASDEVSVPTLSWTTNQFSTTSHNLSVMHSTDGRCTRILIAEGARAAGTWVLETIKNPKPNLTVPFIAGIIGVNTAAAPSDHALTGSGGLYGGSLGALYTYHAATNIRASFTCEGCSGGLLPALLTTQSDWDAGWPMYPVGLMGFTVNGRGRFGQVHDVWAGPSSPRVTGDQFPDGGGPGAERQFTLHGGTIFPWNTTPHVVA
jgi:hypothetical protein